MNDQGDSADRSMRSYDAQFSDAKPGFQANRDTVKVFGTYKCAVCGRETAWINSRLSAYLCSPECAQRFEAQNEK